MYPLNAGPLCFTCNCRKFNGTFFNKGYTFRMLQAIAPEQVIAAAPDTLLREEDKQSPCAAELMSDWIRPASLPAVMLSFFHIIYPRTASIRLSDSTQTVSIRISMQKF
jgi:hypothetical protein